MVREAIVVIGKSHWFLAVAVLAFGSSQLLAQQRNPAATSPGAKVSQTLSRPANLQGLAPGTVFRDCAGCPDMVVVPAGSVKITSPNGKTGPMNGEPPQTSVSIPAAIGVGKYEVTKAQFARFVRASGYATSEGCFAWNGSRYEQDASKDWRNPGFAQTDREPVVCVNWHDATAYTDWLSKKTGKRYRLPTETEWEYAARAGVQGPRPWGDKAADACRYANVADRATMRGVPGTSSWIFHDCDDHRAYTAPAGSYRPNAFGLYDMLGNAWEWTEDCWNENPAGVGAKAGDLPNVECNRSVLRGGGWVDSDAFVSYDFRFFIGAGDRDFYAGFRVVRTD